jgi:hypothetical protein
VISALDEIVRGDWIRAEKHINFAKTLTIEYGNNCSNCGVTFSIPNDTHYLCLECPNEFYICYKCSLKNFQLYEKYRSEYFKNNLTHPEHALLEIRGNEKDIGFQSDSYSM